MVSADLLASPQAQASSHLYSICYWESWCPLAPQMSDWLQRTLPLL